MNQFTTVPIVCPSMSFQMQDLISVDSVGALR